MPPMPHPPTVHTERIEDKPWELQWPWICVLVLVEAAVIAGLVTIEVISSTKNGIASVINVPTFSLATLPNRATIFAWSYGLLWTTVPTLIMGIVIAAWKTTVSATAKRQPYIELMANSVREAKSAKLTLFLDYASSPSWYVWIEAWRNNHLFLGSVFLFSFIASASVPLSASLFFTAASTRSNSISVTNSSVFDDSAYTYSTSLNPALSLADAINAHSAMPPPWMTAKYAFWPYDVDPRMAGNVTLINTTAYSADLNCMLLTGVQSQLGDGFMILNATDRNCTLSIQIKTPTNTQDYCQSWFESNCRDSEFGRIGVLAGTYDSSSTIMLSNASLVSCIPTYSQSYGTLNLSLAPPVAPQYIGFAVENTTQIRLETALVLEYSLSKYTSFDASTQTQVDTLGAAVLSHSEALNISTVFNPLQIQQALEGTYATLFAALLHSYSITSSSISKETPAILTTPITRLYVNAPIVWVLVALFAFMIFFTIYTGIYARIRKSVLTESPTGLFGNAVVLGQSDVTEFISQIHVEHPGEKQIEKFVKGWYSLKDIKCWYEAPKRRIRLDLKKPLRWEWKLNWKTRARRSLPCT
jgi:hypothetical protein